MKIKVKKELLEIFNTIYQAHEFIKNFIDKKEYDIVSSLLSNCQEAAFKIAAVIENSEGEDFISISFIEEYYKAIYEIANNISGYNSNKVKQVLDELLKKAENSLKNDVKEKLEIVFMPYKSSMWDSFDSVWKAAKENPCYDVYVVPIPYYDRNYDNSFGEYHYEGGEFPDYVPIIHYKDYNLEKQHPDKIYIHNPYDGNNFVTSVDPRFYSLELKKYTDELVYIPYFVLAEPNPNIPSIVKEVSGFVLTPGVINADKVIVQSEAMKQTYIKILLNEFGDTAENRQIFDKKILGTGSPKFDKIAETDKNNIDIPDEWLKIIKKPDGTWKKIIFYNTSINALLKNNDRMLDKIYDVFNIFYNNKDEVALLWRPHPLTKATLKSMRPSLLNEYNKIVDKYISDGWGIYDDTPDLEMAITLSDAYYGDNSSVVEMCKNINKPVMIQNVDIVKDINISTLSMVLIDNYIYSSCIFDNSLIKIDLKSGKAEEISHFEIQPSHYLYLNGIHYNNCIWWIPYFASQIAIYNIKENTIDYLDLPPKIDISNDIGKFGVSFIHNNKIYAFGYQSFYILIIDCETKAMKIIDLSSYANKFNIDSMFYKAYNICENKVYIPMVQKNQLFCFNLNNNTFDFFKIDCENKKQNGFTAIEIYENIIILYDWYESKIMLDFNMNIISNTYKTDKEFLNPYRLISKYKNNKKFYLKYFEPQISVNDGKNFYYIGNKKDICWFDNSGWIFLAIVDTPDYIYFQEKKDNCLSVLYKENMHIKKIPLQVVYQNNKINKCVLYIKEGHKYGLKEWINYIL